MITKIQELLIKYKIQIKNNQLYVEAFTHRSYLNEAGKDRSSNERLEFLGDAILSFLVSQYLFTTYPTYPEGLLTNLRSTIVKTETLSEIARSLELGNFLYLSRGEENSGGRKNSSLLADTFEALLGAIFLDQGLIKTQDFIEQALYPHVGQILKTTLHTDYKSQLQEIVQEFTQEPPTYKVVKTEGPDHAKLFWVIVVVDNKENEIGVGKSKQEAEQNAAQKTLEKMEKI